MSAPELLTPPAPADRGHPRRLMLLSYHFPPGTAAGALRWQKLAALADERGWSLDVVTAHPATLSTADAGRLADLPPGTRVWGVRAPERRRPAWQAGLLAAARRLRTPARPGPPAGGAGARAPVADLAWRTEMRWSLAPRELERAYRAWRSFSEEGDWARSAAQAADALVVRGVHRAVVTCGPPHMIHFTGRRVSRRAGIPRVMDMRDQWSRIPATTHELGSPLWFRLAEHYERAAVRDAALVSVNTAAAAESLRELHRTAADRITTVMNGCDEEALPEPVPTDRFVVAYAGSVYLDRDPRPFFRAAARLAREEGLGPDRFRLVFVGHVQEFGGAPLGELARAEGIAAHVEVHPRRPRAEALAMLASAAVLLSLPQGVDLAIPSKIFEYMGFPAWVMALARRGSATEVLLRDTGADVVDPADEAGILEALRTRYRQWRAGERPIPLNADGRFSRRRQAEILFDAIERQVEAGHARGSAA